tara:strand:+ start:2101 stop:2628 length:528 start_codon:yes stop_codon:yes gene_type:complete
MEYKVVQPFALYKWAKNFKRVQDKFYGNRYKLRRIQQIEDFVTLNNFKQIHHIEEVRIDLDLSKDLFVDKQEDADLILVTHQGYSRFPCVGIIEQIYAWLEKCSKLYLCLNRHYLNIDNQKINLDLPDDFQTAITSWLQQSLQDCTVVDMSRDYLDYGQHFTWSLPDRHYYIEKK